MKNFRKVLALVLVVATLFSFVAMTASAKEYTDTDKVSYTEAVDVLSAIGILNGYPDGTFRPTNTIARAEMAKMVAVLSNAGDDISDLYTSACKFADMTGDAVWAKSYVAYCNEMGIVAGRNATTFDPYGKVTGIETAKMLLCLIGFDAKAQGYVGSNWKTHVLADAKNMGLLAGFASDYNADKAITREEAAQMMLNALKAPMVIGTLSKDIVNITNNVWLDENRILIGVGIKDITLADAAKQYGWYVLYGNVVVSPKLVLTNYKGLHWGEGRDCYGNPVTEWSYDNSKGVTVWSAQYAMVPTYTSNEAVELETVLKDEIKGGKKYTVEFYVDGDLDDWWNGKTRDLTDADDNTWDRLNPYTGRGVLTNVYVDDAKLQIVITIKNTYIGVVKDVVKYENTFSVYGTNNTWGKNTFSNAGYDFKDGDIILYWVCNNGCGTTRHLHDAQICTPVTGEVTMATTVRENNFATRLSKSDATVGGKTYNYAKNFNVTSTVEQRDIIYKPQTNTKDSVDLFLDTYGNIMGWRLTDDSVPTEYAYVVENSGRGYNFETDGTGHIDFQDYEAKLVGFTTDKPTPTVTPTDRDIYTAVTNDYVTYYTGRLIAYTTVDGVAEKSATNSTYAETGAYLTAKGTLVDRVGRTLIKGDDETKYMVRTYDYKAKDYVYTVYTGELPASYASLDNKDGSSTIQYFTKTVSTENGTVSVPVLNYVFIDTLFTRVNTHAFILKSDKLIADYELSLIAPDTVAGDLHWGSIEQYTAIVNGVEGYLFLDPLDYPSVGLDPDGEEAALVELMLEMIGYTFDGTPVYAQVGTLTAEPTGTFEYKYSNGMIYVGGQAYEAADDIKIAVCIPTSDGQELKVCDSVAELNNYIEIYKGNHIDKTTGYVTVSGWFYDDGTGIDAEMTEIYINFATQDIT